MYRKRTDLKTWPLQEMAFEHLDYLINQRRQGRKDGNIAHDNSGNKKKTTVFHGGDYLSSESSSSIESGRVSSTKPRLFDDDSNTISTSSVIRYPAIVSQDFSNDHEGDQQPYEQQEPLWSTEPRVFATERSQGKRKYLVGHFGRIADWYWRKSTPCNRHLYEVIRESTPCRLYFDFEYIKAYNKHDISDGDDKASDDDNPEVTTDSFDDDVVEELLMEEFVQELSYDLETFYGLPPLDPSTQIVNLDSSTDRKFSRHWIVILHNKAQKDPTSTSNTNSLSQQSWKVNIDDMKTETGVAASFSEYLFKDAMAVGRFVKRLVGRLADELSVEGGDFDSRRPTLAKFLFVNTEPPLSDSSNIHDGGNTKQYKLSASKKTCFIDLGVYTRNRLFRCLGSSKFGKTVRLQANSVGGKYVSLNLPVSCSNMEDESPQAERIGQNPETSKTLSLEEFISANDWKPHARVLADSLVVPLHTPLEALRSDGHPTGSNKLSKESNAKSNQIQLLDVPEGSFSGITSSNVAIRGGGGRVVASSDMETKKSYTHSYSMSQKGSPLPSLDKFVSTVLARRGEINNRTGLIRAWSIQFGPHNIPMSFTYQMQRNRFCELVGRQHKSNNVFWTIHVDSWTCMQGCHDPDCHGWGSPVFISNANGELDAIQNEFKAWQDELFEQALLNLNLDDITKPSNIQSLTAEQDRRENDQNEFGGALSDDALLQAVIDNPELFP